MNLKLLVFTILLVLIPSICTPMQQEDNTYALGKETSESHIEFYSSEHEASPGMIAKETYKKVVELTAISCVDVMVVNQETNAYFVLTRRDAPAKGLTWIIGGRQEKFKSLTQTACTKCLQEAGLEVKICAELGSWSTVFPDSQWGCPTHTTNAVMLAFCKKQSCNLDGHHEKGRWVPLETVPDNAYLKLVHAKMIEALKAYKISRLHNAVLNKGKEKIDKAHAKLAKFPITSINEKSVEGKTVLMLALTLEENNSNKEIIELLLRYGAELTRDQIHLLDPKNSIHKLIGAHMHAEYLKSVGFLQAFSSKG